MKLILGSPGTWSGMALRVSQCVFAAASIFVMVTAFGGSNYTAFCYMVTVLIFQFMWSLGLACIDIYSIRNEKDYRYLEVATLIVIGDWIMAVLVFSGASASASVAIFFTTDMNFCRVYWRVAIAMRSLRAFDRLGVHRVVTGCCFFFMRVLATRFVFLVISHATLC